MVDMLWDVQLAAKLNMHDGRITVNPEIILIVFCVCFRR